MVYNEDYTRKVLPFLKESYFQDTLERILFEHVKDHLEKFNKNPTVESLSIGISDRTDLSEELLENVYKILGKIKSDKDLETNIDWLKDETEKFCQDKAIYNAVMDSIHILEPEEKRETRDRGEIPKILSDALAGTGVGKSLFMCHCAAANLDAGKNVLYVTLEMAEERIAQRIDANLLDIDIKDLELLSKDKYDEKIEKKCSKITGKLIIKEYPTAVAHAGHFRHLLNELNLKKSQDQI